MIALGLGLGTLSRGRRGAVFARLFDRGSTVDPDGFHGGAGVPEDGAPLALFDAGASVALAGFHGGAGVTEP